MMCSNHPLNNKVTASQEGHELEQEQEHEWEEMGGSKGSGGK